METSSSVRMELPLQIKIEPEDACLSTSQDSSMFEGLSSDTGSSNDNNIPSAVEPNINTVECSVVDVKTEIIKTEFTTTYTDSASSSQAAISDTAEIKIESGCENNNGSEISSEKIADVYATGKCIDSESRNSVLHPSEEGSNVHSSLMAASRTVHDNIQDSHTKTISTTVNDNSIQNIAKTIPAEHKYTNAIRLISRQVSDNLAGRKHTLKSPFPSPKKKRRRVIINSNTLNSSQTDTLVLRNESTKRDSDSSYSPPDSEKEDNTVDSSASDNDDNVQELLYCSSYTVKNTAVVHTPAWQPNARYCHTSNEQNLVSCNMQQKTKPIYVFKVHPEINAPEGIGGDRNPESPQHSSREFIFSEIRCDQTAGRTKALYDKRKSSSTPANDRTSSRKDHSYYGKPNKTNVLSKKKYQICRFHGAISHDHSYSSNDSCECQRQEQSHIHKDHAYASIKQETGRNTEFCVSNQDEDVFEKEISTMYQAIQNIIGNSKQNIVSQKENHSELDKNEKQKVIHKGNGRHNVSFVSQSEDHTELSQNETLKDVENENGIISSVIQMGESNCFGQRAGCVESDKRVIDNRNGEFDSENQTEGRTKLDENTFRKVIDNGKEKAGKYHVLINAAVKQKDIDISCGYCSLRFKSLKHFTSHFTINCTRYRPGALPILISQASSQKVLFLCAFCNVLLNSYEECRKHMTKCARVLETYRMNGSYINLKIHLLPECMSCFSKVIKNGNERFVGLSRSYIEHMIKGHHTLFCNCKGDLDIFKLPKVAESGNAIKGDQYREPECSGDSSIDFQMQQYKPTSIIAKTMDIQIPVCSSFLGTHFIQFQNSNDHTFICGFCAATLHIISEFIAHIDKCQVKRKCKKLPYCISCKTKVPWWDGKDHLKAGFMCGYCIFRFASFEECVEHMEQCEFADKSLPNIRFALLKICFVCHGKRITTQDRTYSMMKMVEKFQVIYRRMNAKFYICDISSIKYSCNQLFRKQPEIKSVVLEEKLKPSGVILENENIGSEIRIQEDGRHVEPVDIGAMKTQIIESNMCPERTKENFGNAGKSDLNDEQKLTRSPSIGTTSDASYGMNNLLDKESARDINEFSDIFDDFSLMRTQTVTSDENTSMKCDRIRDNDKNTGPNLLNIDTVVHFKMNDKTNGDITELESEICDANNFSESDNAVSNDSSAANNISNDFEKEKLENALAIDNSESEMSQKCNDRDNITHELFEDKEIEYGSVRQNISNNFSRPGTESGKTQYVRKIQAASICQEDKCTCRKRYAYHDVCKLDKSFHCGYCWEIFKEKHSFFDHVSKCRLTNECIVLPVRLLSWKSRYICGFCTAEFPKLCLAAHHTEQCAKTFPCVDFDRTLGSIKYKLLTFCFKHNVHTFYPGDIGDDEIDKQFDLYLEAVQQYSGRKICDCGARGRREKSFQKSCCRCHEKFTNEILYSLHVDIHYSQSELCYICGHVRPFKRMKAHMRQSHRINCLGIRCPSKTKRRKIESVCHLCGKILAFRQCLRKHLKYACKANGSKQTRTYNNSFNFSK